MFDLFAFLLIILFIGLIGWHILLAFMGGAVAIAGSAWILLVISVSAIAVAILSVFIFAGLGIFILGGLVGIWVLIALIIFPVLFPILLPLFLLFWFIAYARRKKNIEVKEVKHESK